MVFRTFLFLILFAIAQGANAEVLRVDTLSDSGPNSLRDRIENDATAGDTVWVDVSGTIQLSSSITIGVPVTIFGPTPAHLTISGQDAYRPFVIDHPNETTYMRDLRIEDGYSGSQPGGAIRILNGSLRMSYCRIDDCSAEANGGAIANSDTLYFAFSSIMDCLTSNGGHGGAIYSKGAFFVSHSTLAMNSSNGRGGAIMNDSAFGRLYQSTVIHNESTGEGGGVASVYHSSPNSMKMGGDIVEYNDAFVSGKNLYTSSGDTIRSDDYNLISDTTGANFDKQASDLIQGAGTSGLSDTGLYQVNGHGYRYYPLPDTSDALERKPNVATNIKDQRRAPRVLDADTNGSKYMDAGAVEYTPFVVDDGGGGGGISLSDALQAIGNIGTAAPPYYVAFDIPSVPASISHSSAFELAYTTVVDGWSQEGSRVPGPNDPGNTDQQVTPGQSVISIDGGLSSINGIRVLQNAKGSELRGLSVHSHSGIGVEVRADSVRINGMYLGDDPNGFGSYNSKGDIEYYIGAGGSKVGGVRHFRRNVMVNGPDHHIHVTSDAGYGHRIHGNFIGASGEGDSTLSTTTSRGILVETAGNRIGSGFLSGANLLSGNQGGPAVHIDGGSLVTTSGNKVAFNRIGTDHRGTDSLGNQEGIRVDSSSKVFIRQNQISENEQEGIVLKHVDSSYVRGNLIGVDKYGLSAMGNSEGVVLQNCIGVVVGGLLHSDSSNVISGNDGMGLFAYGNGSGQNMIQGNLIGTDKSGMQRVSNGSYGIQFAGGDTLIIGGQLGSEGNIISGNSEHGIYQNFSGPSSYLIAIGNQIGLDSTRNDTLGNGKHGVYLNDDGRASIGVPNYPTSYRNLIAGNKGNGIRIGGSSSQHVVANNRIGTNGTLDTLGNDSAGVRIVGDSNLIGTDSGNPNSIAFNGKEGIRVDAGASGNRFYENKIFLNQKLGVDLEGDGVTSNDLGDSDGGANGLTNFPELLGVTSCGGNTQAKFVYDGQADTTHRIDFYVVPSGRGDPTGHGEGSIYIGSDTISMSSTPPDTFSSTLTSIGFVNGDSLTATATNLDSHETSEFAANIAAYDSIFLTLDTAQPVTCAGDSDGTASVSINGGIPPYNVTWYTNSYSVTVGTGTTQTGLGPGNYQVTLMDDLGCEDTLSVTINPADTLSVADSVLQNETCAGACDGKMYADILGGTTPYTVKWDSLGTGDTLTGDTISSLCSGDYDLLVTDSNGCSATDTTATVLAGDSIQVSTSPDTSICRGDSASLLASGGTGYWWTPTDSLSDDTVSDPYAFPDTATEYVVTVDSSGCTRNDTVLVSVDSLPSVSAGPDTNICEGDSVLITASGGSSYSWSPNASLSAPTNSTTDAFPASDQLYVVTVTDSNSCSDTGSVQVSIDTLPTVDAGKDTTVCKGFPAKLGGSPTSSISTVIYDWDPDSVVSTPSDSNPVGTPSDTTDYTLTVTDTPSNCVARDTVRVSVVPAVTAYAGTDDTICKGDSTVLGGSPSATGGSGIYNYFWAPIDSLSSFTASDPYAYPSSDTTYELTVIDSLHQCADYDSVKVSVRSNPTLQVSGEDSLCVGDSTTLLASGTADEYQWGGITADSISIAPSTDSSVYVNAIDTSSGCNSDTSVLVQVFNPPSVILSGPSAACPGDTVYLDGVGAKSYEWQDGTQDSSYSDLPDSTKTYWVKGYNSVGCSSTDSLTVSLYPEPPSPTASKTSYVLCQGDTASALGVAPDTSYQNRWYTGSAPTGLISSGDTLTGISLSGDTLRRYAAMKDTATGCTGPVLGFEVLAFDSSSVNTSSDTAICQGKEVQLSAAGGVSYSWSPAEGLDDPGSATPVAAPVGSKTYKVTVESKNGCTVMDSVRVDIRSDGSCDLTTYNAFSPNEDGSNETWIIEGVRAFPDNQVTIYNRWGDRVISFKGYDNQEVVWRGKRGNGQKLPSGTYFYVIEIEGDNGPQKKTGYVQITR